MSSFQEQELEAIKKELEITKKELETLKEKYKYIEDDNEKLEDKIWKIRRIFGWEITEFFNSCSSFRETTKKYHFEDEYDCFCALEDYFGNPDFQWTANDYDICYDEVFSIEDPISFPPKNNRDEDKDKDKLV
jgi:hypothetical protein